LSAWRKLNTPTEEGERADYEKWKYMWSEVPFRYAFGGLAIAGILGVVTFESAWNGPYRWLAVLLTVVFFGGTLRLFYDIPQRRLSLFSKVFLSFGLAVPLILVVVGLLE
jgi:hypothetical protein